MDTALPIPLLPQWGEWEGIEASVRLRREGQRLHVRFMVRERELRRMVTAHNDAVWKDSCVEAFLQREGRDEYVTVECSASGRMLVARGPGRADRTFFSPSYIDTIPLGVTILENSNLQSRWRADLVLDLVGLGLSEEGERMEDVRLRGNFYKCGDELAVPHYLAAGEIMTSAPDFHRPEYFIPLTFVE